MHHYTGCGLRNVYLKSGYRQHKTPYGDGVAIDDVEGLHRAIALHLVGCKKRLSGSEFRFLRKELELSQLQLAAVLGNDAQSVALWEKTGRVPKWADLMLRALYREVVEGKAGIVELVERLNKIAGEPAVLTFSDTKSGWKAAA
jgi:putative transcriptional regulator